MTQVAGPRIAQVNGINIAFRVQGDGPPLVLIMGYRLSSAAWPAKFVDALARSFTVVTLDNRGTGQSDKPVTGYALANMARDAAAVLDELSIERAYVLGYSMGGAIAQEFVRQFPHRAAGLVLCATLCGGPRATYAEPSVVRVMCDLDGLSTEKIARRIWKVTYAPDYLKKSLEAAEAQMRREIALPTPLHAADLQFQAFAEFDGSQALSQIKCPVLVLTGDLDELIPPQNSPAMAKLIPNAKLVVIPGGGHRVLWEAVEECTALITDFLTSIRTGPRAIPQHAHAQAHATTPAQAMLSVAELFTAWPLAAARAGFETLSIARQSILVGSSARFGDGKPIIILAPQFVGSEWMLLPLSAWLKALGYRPLTAGHSFNPNDLSLAKAICGITRRVGRKAVLVTHCSGLARALRTAASHREAISDVVVLGAMCRLRTEGLRTHFITSDLLGLYGLVDLPRVLRGIGIELIGDVSLDA
jgi:pimeloyl-ACP methyl ester carboxylesterase